MGTDTESTSHWVEDVLWGHTLNQLHTGLSMFYGDALNQLHTV